MRNRILPSYYREWHQKGRNLAGDEELISGEGEVPLTTALQRLELEERAKEQEAELRVKEIQLKEKELEVQLRLKELEISGATPVGPPSTRSTETGSRDSFWHE